MVSRLGAILLVLLLAACGDDSVTDEGAGQPADCYEGGCTTNELPFGQSADAPTLTEIILECQPGSIVVLATVTDAQGTPNLLGISQTIGVFPDRDCLTAPITVEDDLAGSGLEESFGDAVLAHENQALYDQICACDTWPVEVEFRDGDDNVTEGRVIATVRD